MVGTTSVDVYEIFLLCECNKEYITIHKDIVVRLFYFFIHIIYIYTYITCIYYKKCIKREHTDVPTFSKYIIIHFKYYIQTDLYFNLIYLDKILINNCRLWKVYHKEMCY